jgi:uncharacterized protein (PEP-CTERM system associated)
MAVTASKAQSRALSCRRAPLGAFSVLMAALVAASVFSPLAQAIEWDVTPSISATSTATDNSSQSSSNSQGSLITTVSPGISLVSKGSRRIKAALSYRVTGIVRVGGDNQSNNINHNLAANGKAELVEDFLYLDGSANISQQLISLLGSPADANTNNSNRATVGTYSISPYAQKRFGSFANGLLRYTHSAAIFQNNVSGNSQSDGVIAALSSGSRFDVIDWSLNYSERHTNNGSSTSLQSNTTNFETESATLGLKVSRTFRVFATVGRDSNNFINAAELNGDYYTAGVDWRPSDRTSIQASAGKRYLGNTYALSLRHSGHHTHWGASYSESVSDVSQQQQEVGSTLLYLCSGLVVPVIPPAEPLTGCTGPLTLTEILFLAQFNPALFSGNYLSTSLVKGVFINKSFNSNVNWSHGKLGLGVSVFDTRRVFILQGNQEDHSSGITGTVNYRLTPTISADGSLSFTNYQTPGSLSGLAVNRSDDLYTVSFGLTRRFDPKLTGSLRFLHQTRQSNQATGNFDSNSIIASVNKTF